MEADPIESIFALIGNYPRSPPPGLNDMYLGNRSKEGSKSQDLIPDMLSDSSGSLLPLRATFFKFRSLSTFPMVAARCTFGMRLRPRLCSMGNSVSWPH